MSGAGVSVPPTNQPAKRFPHGQQKGLTMSDSLEQEKVLRISSRRGDSVTLQLEASTPVTVRLQIDGTCTCHDGISAVDRPGSYVYSDPAGRQK